MERKVVEALVWRGMAAKVRFSGRAKAGDYLWPLPMTMVEASFNGTLRTILVLVVLWWLLRLFLRYQQTQRSAPLHKTSDPVRPPGEVRIEKPAQGDRSGHSGGGQVIDADFEEIK